jgi:hypothetical protein
MENTTTTPKTDQERAQEVINVRRDADEKRLQQEETERQQREKAISRSSVFGLNKPKPTSGGRRRTMRRKHKQSKHRRRSARRY